MKTNAIRIHKYGGPEVLSWDEIDVPDPGPGEALIRHTAIGLNFIDTYHRTGLYPVTLPAGLGTEAAGVVTAVGAGVTEIAPGDRVVYVDPAANACTEMGNVDAACLVPIPETLSDDLAAAIFLKGLTAWYLLRRSHRVREGEPILLYAAAGGVGSLVSQWAKHLGATVIGIVSSDDKAKLASKQGCDYIIMADDENISERVKSLTDGKGVAVVYDSVGRDTFLTSLDCLRPHGTLVSFGNASGAVDPFALAELAKRGSLYVTRPILFDFINTRQKLVLAANELFDLVQTGVLRASIGQTYALKDTAQAHRDLEERKTIGSTILIP